MTLIVQKVATLPATDPASIDNCYRAIILLIYCFFKLQLNHLSLQRQLWYLLQISKTKNNYFTRENTLTLKITSTTITAFIDIEVK